MAFPQDVLNVTTQLLITGESFGGSTRKRWTTITGIRAETGVNLTSGRANEQSKVAATSVTKTLNNQEGDYSPRYPLSPYFETLSKNIKMREIVALYPNLSDDFNRSVSNGWTGGSFTWTLAGGTVPNDYDIDGDEGTILFASTAVQQGANANSQSPDHLVRAQWDLSAADITGGSVDFEIRGRKTSSNDNTNYYALRLTYSTTEQAAITLVKSVAGSEATVATGSTLNLSGAADTDLIGELYIEGNRLYGKVFQRAGDDYYYWDVKGEDDDLTTGTYVGVGGRRNTGNTNANILIRVNQFDAFPGTIRSTTEIASFNQRWDSTGNDKYAPIQSAGLKRRMSKGSRPLRSAYWREVERGTGLIGFWPLNDGADSLIARSGLLGGVYGNYLPEDGFTSEQILDWLEPMASPDDGTFLGFESNCSQDTSDTQWSFDFLFQMEASVENADVSFFFNGSGEGTPSSPRIEWFLTMYQLGATDSFLTWEFYAQVNTGSGTTSTLIDDGTVAVVNGNVHHVRVITTNISALSTDWEILINNASIASGNVATFWDVVRNIFGTIESTQGQVAFGGFALWDNDNPPFNAANAAVIGRSGETAGNRFTRLCDESGIKYEVHGDADETEPLGPQLIDTLLANLEICEAVDMGIMYEPRHFFGFVFRTRENLYEQTPIELDYASAHLSGSLDDTDDDYYIANDVTLRRTNGSSWREVQEEGSLNIQEPEEDPDGVGLYDVEEQYHCDLDDQLPRATQWRLHLGTYDSQQRFPVVMIDLHRAVFTSNTALLRSIVHLREGDTFNIINPLSPPLAPDDLKFMVEGRKESYSNFSWQVRYNTSPADRYAIGIYDDPDNLARWDTENATVTSQITTGTSTSMSITTSNSGDLWITGSGAPEFPFDIDLLGARVRVTAISGASSPQTATISATVVNGINKVIPAGTQIRLWDDVRYGL